MKVHMFHLMPYRFLPDDFTERYRSVWVDVPRELFDAEKVKGLYAEYLDQLELADREGFDGICVNEHHQNAYGLMPSPNIMAASLARRTSQAALVVLGNSIALYNPPIRVAEEFAMLDLLSDGRLVTGFPVGTSMDTNYAYGVTPATLRERYYEAHDLIVRAWTEPEPFMFNGKYTQLRYVNLWPRPLQEPHPPVWIPGGGSLETWDWTTRLNYVYCYLSYYGYLRGEKVMQGYWDKVQEMGGDMNPHRAGFLQLVCVGDSMEQARRDYAEHVSYFYDRCLHIYQGFADAPGYRTPKTVKAGLGPQVGAAAQAARHGLTWDQYLDQGYLVAGDPGQVIDRLKDVVERLRVGQLMVLLQIGSMPPDLAERNIRKFAAEVLPEMRKLWPEYEDFWTPTATGGHWRERQPAAVH